MASFDILKLDDERSQRLLQGFQGFRPDVFLNFENEIALLYNGGYRNTISKLKGVTDMTNKIK